MILNKKFNSGFTLIELLVVISIIAILVAVSLFGIQGARVSARDTKRKADLADVASALELFKSDCGHYPQTLPAAGSAITSTAANCPNGTAGNTYKAAMPDDPVSGRDYAYQGLPALCTATTCTAFQFWTDLENSSGVPSTCAGTPPSCTAGTCNFCVTNP